MLVFISISIMMLVSSWSWYLRVEKGSFVLDWFMGTITSLQSTLLFLLCSLHLVIRKKWFNFDVAICSLTISLLRSFTTHDHEKYFLPYYVIVAIIITFIWFHQKYNNCYYTVIIAENMHFHFSITITIIILPWHWSLLLIATKSTMLWLWQKYFSPRRSLNRDHDKYIFSFQL